MQPPSTSPMQSPPQGGGGPAPSGVIGIRGGVTPGHEVATMGPKAIAAYEHATQTQQDATKEIANIQQSAAAHQAATAQVAKDDAEKEIARGQAMQVEQNRVAKEKADAVQQASAGLDKPIESYWSDKSAGTKVILGLAAGLGQLGAGLAGKGGANPVMAMIQNEMDQDLKTKQMNFQRGIAKKDAAQQDFNNTVHRIGLAPASDVIQAAMKSKLAATAMQEAAVTKNQDVAANAVQMAATLTADADKHRANAELGYVPPRASAPQYMLPGNPIPVSGDKAFGALEHRSEQAGEQANRLEIAGMAKAGKTDEGTKFIAQELAQKKIPEAQAAIQRARNSMTPSKDNPNAQAGLGKTGEFLKDVGGDYAYGAVHGQAALSREKDWEMATADVMHTLGGVLSKDEYARYKGMLNAANSPEDRANTLASMTAKLQAAEQSIAAGAGPEAWARYQQNRAAVTPPKINETPVKR